MVGARIDTALPLVQLSKRHEALKLAGVPAYYFYAHRALGFTLITYLVAGLSGLAK